MHFGGRLRSEELVGLRVFHMMIVDSTGSTLYVLCMYGVWTDACTYALIIRHED